MAREVQNGKKLPLKSMAFRGVCLGIRHCTRRNQRRHYRQTVGTDGHVHIVHVPHHVFVFSLEIRSCGCHPSGHNGRRRAPTLLLGQEAKHPVVRAHVNHVANRALKRSIRRGNDEARSNPPFGSSTPQSPLDTASSEALPTPRTTILLISPTIRDCHFRNVHNNVSFCDCNLFETHSF